MALHSPSLEKRRSHKKPGVFHWVARAVADGRQPLHATCRGVSETGLIFNCDESFAVGSELTLWVAWPSAVRSGQLDWTPFSLRVTCHGSSEGRYRMETEFHLTLPESLHALRRVLLADSRTGHGSNDRKRSLAGSAIRRIPAASGRLMDDFAPPEGSRAIFHYEGPVDEPKVRALVTQAQKQLMASRADQRLTRAATAVAAELLRNAEMHGVTPAEMGLRGTAAERPQAAILIAICSTPIGPHAASATGAWIECSNIVESKSVPQLVPLYRALHSLSAEVVRARLSTVLKSLDWRAGVDEMPVPRFGMLTLARECRAPISVRANPLEPNDPEFVKLSIGVTV